MSIMGAVLAGGRSSRFGSDKAQALVDGRTLLDHAVAALAPHVAVVAVCGREAAGQLSLADRPAPDMGPLGGINAALHHARERGFAGVLTTGCDMPHFPAALALALIGEGPAILEGQQLAGYWPTALATELDAHLQSPPNLSIGAWMERVKVRRVRLPDIILPNINRLEDLEALKQGARPQ